MSFFNRKKIESTMIDDSDDALIDNETKVDVRTQLYQKEEEKTKKELKVLLLHKGTSGGFYTVLLISLLVAIIKIDVANMILLAPFLMSIYIIGKRDKVFEYGVVENYYMWNLTTTLRLTARNTKMFSLLYDKRLLISYIAVAIISLEQLLLRSFLPYGWSVSLAGLSYTLVILGAVSLFAERETRQMSHVFFALTIGLYISTSAAYWFYGYLNGMNIVFAIFSYFLALRSYQIQIKHVDEKELEKAFRNLS